MRRWLFSHAVAVSIGVWLAEAGRYYSQHAPVRHHPIIERLNP